MEQPTNKTGSEPVQEPEYVIVKKELTVNDFYGNPVTVPVGTVGTTVPKQAIKVNNTLDLTPTQRRRAPRPRVKAFKDENFLHEREIDFLGYGRITLSNILLEAHTNPYDPNNPPVVEPSESVGVLPGPTEEKISFRTTGRVYVPLFNTPVTPMIDLKDIRERRFDMIKRIMEETQDRLFKKTIEAMNKNVVLGTTV
jgi:hypothetical protein